MHLEGLSGHRGSSIPLQHSVITQKLLQKANIKKKKDIFSLGGGEERIEQQQITARLRKLETGLQLGCGAAPVFAV